MRVSYCVFLLVLCTALAACSSQSPTIPKGTASKPATPNGSAISFDWSKTGAATKSAIIHIGTEAGPGIILDRSRESISTFAAQGAANRQTLFITLKTGLHGTGSTVGKTSLTTGVGSAVSIAPSVGGTCASIAIAPIGNEPFVEAPPPPVGVPPGSASTSYTLVGPQTERFVATPLDANGNPIVPINALAGSVLLFQTDARNYDIDSTGDNTFAFRPLNHTTDEPTPVVPFAPECLNVAGTIARNPIVFYGSSIVYIADVNIASGSGGILTFDDSGNPISAPGGFPGPLICVPDDDPEHYFVPDIIYDRFLSRLYVPTPGCNVKVYDLSGNAIATTGSFTPGSSVGGGAFSSLSRLLWINTFLHSKITIYNENGNFVGESSNLFPFSALSEAYDPHLHRMYVAGASGTAPVIALTDLLANVPTPGGFPNLQLGDEPVGIAYDPLNNDLYIPANSQHAVRIYNEAGYDVTPAGAFSIGADHPYGAAIDPFGKHVYITNCTHNSIPFTNGFGSSGYVSRFDQSGNIQSLLTGAFAGVVCPEAVTVVPP